MTILYSKYGYRSTLISHIADKDLNWLFLPGGPGLGSESFDFLGKSLILPGKTWYVDHPHDGSNQNNSPIDFEHWPRGLLDLASSFKNVIIVAHSFSGMFVLSTPDIEKFLKGLVLMNTSPDKSWLQLSRIEADKNQLPDISDIQKNYIIHPSNDSFKELIMASAPYFFSPFGVDKGRALLESLPVSFASHLWASQSFHHTYRASFIPDCPTLIIGSEFDFITPLKLFTDNNEWQKENISISLLKGAGHFPWIEKMDKMKKIFTCFAKNF